MSNSIYAQALISESNYTAELERVYGKREACNARYDRKRNEATPELKRLAQLWQLDCENLLRLNH